MSEQHPRCPHCHGLLKYEPADILGPERVKCILCGWEKARPAAPVKPLPVPETAKPSPAPSAATIKRAAPGTLITFGTCPSCQRPDMKLNHSGKCGRCAYRLLKGIDLLLPSQKPGIAAPRQAVTQLKPEIKEITMTTKITPRGHCPTCDRDDVLMPGPKCSRCYDRISKGRDPKTNEPVTAQETTKTREAATPPPPLPRKSPCRPHCTPAYVRSIWFRCWMVSGQKSGLPCSAN